MSIINYERILKLNNIKIDIFTDDDEYLFNLIDICKYLNIEEDIDSIKKKYILFDCHIFRTINEDIKQLYEDYISESDLEKLLNDSDDPKYKKLAELLGLLNKKEKTLKQIYSVFKYEKYIISYDASKYFIDLYFTNLNIAIFCNENPVIKNEENKRKYFIENYINAYYI